MKCQLAKLALGWNTLPRKVELVGPEAVQTDRGLGQFQHPQLLTF